MKKFLSIMFILTLMFTFAACGSSSKDKATDDSDSDTLIMATNAEFPPYEYHENDANGKDQIVGIDAEIAQAIADKLGMKLQIEDMEFDSIIASVQSGKADFGMAGMTVTDERKQSVSFTDSYAKGVQVVIVPDGSPITSVADLTAEGNNYSVGVQTSTTGDLYTTSDIEDKGLGTIERYDKGADAVNALVSGKIDCVVIDNEPAKAYVAANKGLKILDTDYITEDYAICVAKDNTKLLDKINTALQELKDDGTVQSIIDKYINSGSSSESE